LGLISTLVQALVGNYFGIFALMFLEGTSLPIPSEVVMPLGGALSRDGSLTIWLVIVVGTMGSLLGSLVDYYVALYAGEAVVKRYGTYFHITENRLNSVQKWFSNYGTLAVFSMRFVPGFRALISFPAGFGRMKIVKFIGATFLGHLIWDTILAYLGYTYSSSWNTLISVVDQYLNYIAAVLAVVIIAYLIFLFIKTRTR